jgi:undecaprenyl diphosphate synthase
MWQTAYSEFYFTDIHWPDFERRHLIEAVRDYQSRERRFGAVKTIP